MQHINKIWRLSLLLYCFNLLQDLFSAIYSNPPMNLFKYAKCVKIVHKILRMNNAR